MGAHHSFQLVPFLNVRSSYEHSVSSCSQQSCLISVGSRASGGMQKAEQPWHWRLRSQILVVRNYEKGNYLLSVNFEPRAAPDKYSSVVETVTVRDGPFQSQQFYTGDCVFAAAHNFRTLTEQHCSALMPNDTAASKWLQNPFRFVRF
jgi:hypothetical protein